VRDPPPPFRNRPELTTGPDFSFTTYRHQEEKERIGLWESTQVGNQERDRRKEGKKVDVSGQRSKEKKGSVEARVGGGRSREGREGEGGMHVQKR
jgi:hypothetical protein